MTKLPTYFLSHGGGPWPYMQGDMRERHAQLEASLKEIPKQLAEKPTAILMVSAHWDQPIFSLMTNAQPPMLYDYYGFPPDTYEIQYAAPGAPELAQRVKSSLEKSGFEIAVDSRRGFDHGTFAPLAIVYPNAEIPILQLSLRSDFDPRAHLQLGRALAPLRAEGVLIIGSGLSYHNLRHFGPQAREISKEFDTWLDAAMNSNSVDRDEQLIQWESAPSARMAHPREEHLIPLMVAVGAAHEEKAKRFYHEENFFGGLSVSSYRFG